MNQCYSNCKVTNYVGLAMYCKGTCMTLARNWSPVCSCLPLPRFTQQASSSLASLLLCGLTEHAGEGAATPCVCTLLPCPGVYQQLAAVASISPLLWLGPYKCG